MANDLKGFNWWEGTDEMLAFHITVSCIAHGATDLKVNNLEQTYYRKEHGTWEKFESPPVSIVLPNKLATKLYTI